MTVGEKLQLINDAIGALFKARDILRYVDCDRTADRVEKLVTRYVHMDFARAHRGTWGLPADTEIV